MEDVFPPAWCNKGPLLSAFLDARTDCLECAFDLGGGVMGTDEGRYCVGIEGQ